MNLNSEQTIDSVEEYAPAILLESIESLQTLKVKHFRDKEHVFAISEALTVLKRVLGDIQVYNFEEVIK